MSPLPNLIHYTSVCKRGTHTYTLAEYTDGDGELPQIASKCLQLLPPHHSRFSHTTNQRMFACIIDEPFLFCAITDEALSRSQAMSFLEQVQHEFTSYAGVCGLLADHSILEPHSLDSVFGPIFRCLVSPFVGIPQKEKDRIAEETESRMYAEADADAEAGLSRAYCSAETSAYDNYDQASPCFDRSSGSRSPSTPLIGKTSGKKHKQKKHKDEGRNSSDGGEDKVHRMEITKDGGSPKGQMQRLGSSKSFRGQQAAQRMWWKCVKIVLLLDAIVCLILFGIWLGICKGFTCMKVDNSS
eukprot:c17256_g1_i1 orf=479-1375(+)